MSTTGLTTKPSRWRAVVASALTAAALAACGLPPIIPAQSPLPQTKLIVVLVGPPADAQETRGLWALYGGRDVAHDHFLLPEIGRATGLSRNEILHYYFSFAGNEETTQGLLARYAWGTDGAPRILERLRDALAQADARRIPVAIIGWRNGGATAYELACRMGASRAPALLVTLDPVGQGTRPCPAYSEGRLATPPHWINVHASGDPTALPGPAEALSAAWTPWGASGMPSDPASVHRYAGPPTDARRMWETIVDRDRVYLAFGASLRPTGTSAR